MAPAPSAALATGTATIQAGATQTGATSTGAPAVAVSGGWSHDTSSYIGTYSLVPVARTVAPATVSSPAAGVFSLAVRAAARLQADSGPLSGGSLTTFLRKVKTGEPLAPSGILSVFGSAGTEVLYLTDLDVHGNQRIATVDGGSFLGIPIGRFTATPSSGGVLDAVIRASGLGTAHVRLVHFSAAPPSS